MIIPSNGQMIEFHNTTTVFVYWGGGKEEEGERKGRECKEGDYHFRDNSG